MTPHLRRFWIGMLGYVVLLIVTVTARPLAGGGVPAALFVLLPMVPLTYAMVAIFQAVRAQDELVQRIHLQSVLATALATAAVTFGWGLLEAADLLPALYIGPGMIAIWGVCNALISRRYQ